jgi:CRP-like cAMP-binding protein
MRQPIDPFFQQLAALPVFEGLPIAQLARLAAASREQRYGKDARVFQKGDRPTGLFAVLSGTLKLACQSPRGKEKVIGLPGPGQLFGEAALLLDCPYPFAASALTSARLLHVDGRVLRDLVACSSDLAHRMLSHVSDGICTIIGDLEDFRMRAPRERVARFLFDRSAAAGPDAGAITFPTSKHIFASRLGMVPESLTRAMRDLADAGLIEIGKDHIRVLDRKGLAMLAG